MARRRPSPREGADAARATRRTPWRPPGPCLPDLVPADPSDEITCRPGRLGPDLRSCHRRAAAPTTRRARWSSGRPTGPPAGGRGVPRAEPVRAASRAMGVRRRRPGVDRPPRRGVHLRRNQARGGLPRALVAERVRTSPTMQPACSRTPNATEPKTMVRAAACGGRRPHHVYGSWKAPTSSRPPTADEPSRTSTSGGNFSARSTRTRRRAPALPRCRGSTPTPHVPCGPPRRRSRASRVTVLIVSGRPRKDAWRWANSSVCQRSLGPVRPDQHAARRVRRMPRTDHHDRAVGVA